jgi:ComF family protein
MGSVAHKSFVASIREYLGDFVNLLFPNLCNACGTHLAKGEEIICLTCEYQLPKTNFHLLADNQVVRNFWGRVEVQNATSLYYFNKGGGVQQLIHRLKYNGKKEIGLKMGRDLGLQLKASELYTEIDLVIPVPLHKKKLKDRGYNQCDLFAQGVAEAMGIEWSATALQRTSYTVSQTGKTRTERWQNVKDIFEPLEVASIEGRHVLLVDDVITTGATLEACASAILKVPGTKVSVATIAMAV